MGPSGAAGFSGAARFWPAELSRADDPVERCAPSEPDEPPEPEELPERAALVGSGAGEGPS